MKLGATGDHVMSIFISHCTRGAYHYSVLNTHPLSWTAYTVTPAFF